MNENQPALKVHWKLPLTVKDDEIIDANGRPVCSCQDSHFNIHADANHAAAFVALANGGLLEKCLAQAMEIDRLKDALKPGREVKTVFVVMGDTGEYSDQRDWIVCAYEYEALAKEHVEQAQLVANVLEAKMPQRDWGEPLLNPYDPDMQMDNTGTRYYCATVVLRTSVPEVKP